MNQKKISMIGLLVAGCLTEGAFAGPYSTAAGTSGSKAVSKDDTNIIAWANGHTQLVYGTDVDDEWKMPEKAYGKAEGNSFDIVCLGNGGQITMTFPHPITDGEGYDFAVFENSFSDNFLELAFVEVSSDGVNYFRFPNVSLTSSAVGGFGYIDPSNLHGLASKYEQGFGTPFDISDLPNHSDLDKRHIRFIRILDIIGDGRESDSEGNLIYDPTPTIGSGGFDLDGIGVFHQNSGSFHTVESHIQEGVFHLGWESNPGTFYRIESSLTMTQNDWTLVETVIGSSTTGISTYEISVPDEPRMFWRVVRVDGAP